MEFRTEYLSEMRQKTLPLPHRPGRLLAALDDLYLAPEVRGGLTALRLLRHAETALRQRGVAVMQFSSPASRPCHALYRRLGGTTYRKHLAQGGALMAIASSTAAGLIGRQRAAAGASGAQVDAGSQLDLPLDTAEKGALDAFSLREQGLRTAHNAELSAWSQRNSAQGAALQADYLRQTNETDYLGLTRTLLGSTQRAGHNFQLLTGRGPTLR